ncbi:MAG TPA: hypothetical protein VJH65_02810 [Candidatus Nanoarchaeia archaeon]|nr:hypothetical protein [Candidatus Nanoarchaeia archaeon]
MPLYSLPKTHGVLPPALAGGFFGVRKNLLIFGAQKTTGFLGFGTQRKSCQFWIFGAFKNQKFLMEKDGQLSQESSQIQILDDCQKFQFENF